MEWDQDRDIRRRCDRVCLGSLGRRAFRLCGSGRITCRPFLCVADVGVERSVGSINKHAHNCHLGIFLGGEKVARANGGGQVYVKRRRAGASVWFWRVDCLRDVL